MQRYKKPSNSWQKVGKWYGKITQGEGHYYHKNVIIPKLLKLLNFSSDSKVLDLGCGSGILGRSVPQNVNYLGVDLSTALVIQASKQDRNPKHKYIVADASKLNIKDSNFSHIFFILSLQNMKNPQEAIQEATKRMRNGAKLYLVLNHPAFRIARQSSWEIDSKNKTEYRRINRYMSHLQIPINMNPSDRNSELTWTYHYPISFFTNLLSSNNLVINNIDEWNSDKTSVGSAAKMENIARQEFPLFMTIIATKI